MGGAVLVTPFFLGGGGRGGDFVDSEILRSTICFDVVGHLMLEQQPRDVSSCFNF